MTTFVANDPRINDFVSKSVGSTDCLAHTSLGVEKDGEIVVGALLDNYSGQNVFVHFSNKPGVSIPRDFLRWIFGYCFDGLKVQRVSASFPQTCTKVIKLAKLIGFQYETRLENVYHDNVSMMIYRLYRQECRFLP